jgi:hypothetical protein
MLLILLNASQEKLIQQDNRVKAMQWLRAGGVGKVSLHEDGEMVDFTAAERIMLIDSMLEGRVFVLFFFFHLHAC